MRVIVSSIALVVLAAAAPAARAQEVHELLGSWLIDGYTFQPGDRSPRGTIAYDPRANTFRGTYVGVKLPGDRPELHAWLYNTETRKALHVGRIPYRAGTVGKTKGDFALPLPGEFKGGKFAGWELIAAPEIVIGAATLTIVSGFYLIWVASGGFAGAWFATRFGQGMSTGMLAAILAYLLGVFTVRPALYRVLALGGQMAQATAGDRPAIEQQMLAARGRMIKAGGVGSVLLLVAILSMAVARYL